MVGRYILTPRIFDLLEAIPSGIGGEIQLTDAIAELLKEETVTAYPFQGKRYDCGSKLGFIEATLAHALRRPDIGPFLAPAVSRAAGAGRAGGSGVVSLCSLPLP